MSYYGNYVDITSTQTITGNKTLTITGAGTTTPLTVVIDSSVATQAALVAKNNTNFAHGGAVVSIQMVNGSDSGNPLLISNAGTGASLLIQDGSNNAKFTVSQAGNLTLVDGATVALGTTTGTKIGTATTQKVALHGLTPVVQSTGYSITGGTPTKTLTLDTASATTITNFLQQLLTDLIAKGVIGA